MFNRRSFRAGLRLGVVALALAVLGAVLSGTAPAQAAGAPLDDDAPDMDWLTPSLAFDSQGGPHIGYWAKNLGNDPRYASWDEAQGQWNSEIVDESAWAGRYTSLVLDAADRPHMSYYDISHAALRYATWDGSQWLAQTVDSGGDVGQYQTSIAVDAAGVPYISYYDLTNADLKLAYWDAAPGQWNIQVVDAPGNVGAYSSLQLDPAGGVHISYADISHRALKVAHGRRSGSTWLWQIETVEVLAARPEYTSLALDAGGLPRVSYYDLAQADLRYAAWNALSGSWETQVVDGGGAGGDAGRFSSLALDAAGNPIISYHDTTAARLRLARWDGSRWLTDTVDVVTPMGATSLKLDAAGQPHVVYGDKDTFDLRYAFWDAAQQEWVHQIVYSEEEAGVGYYNSLELDPALNAHVSYYDKVDRDLKYARRSWNGFAWVWEVQVLDAAGRTGRYTTIRLEHAGLPRIGYLDSEELELSYAVWDGAQWTVEAVPNDYGMGRFGSMALDADDHPHFASYAQDSRGGLAYAHWDGSQWHSELVDAQELAGFSTSIAIDAAGHPHISYTDAANHVMKYARWEGSQWITQTVDTIGTAHDAHRLGTSIALDANGWPHIAYYDSAGKDLRLASWDGAGWILEAVDAEGWVGTRPSLRLDGDGHPRIGYRDQTNSALKYAAWDGTAWSLERVDDEGDAGWFLSLALEPAPPYAPHLSYMELDQGVLKYASWDGERWAIESVDGEPGEPVEILALESDQPVALGRTMHFTATVTGDEPISYTWDLGPGTRGGTDTHPTFVYSQTGTFSVTLTVHNAVSSSDTRTISVHVGPDVGDHVSLAVDGNGLPYLSYHDLTNDRLRAAHWDGAGWDVEVVDATGLGGQGSAIAVDAANRPRISYLAPVSWRLRFASWDGTAWTPEVVDWADRGTLSTAGAVDGSGVSHIGYLARGTRNLKYARQNGTQWLLQVVDSTVRAGGALSLDLDAGDRPHLSYYDRTHKDLRYAHWDGAQWLVETVDSAGDVGRTSTSLRLDAAGRPHISYFHYGQGDLRYAAWNGAAWIVQTVDSRGRVGTYSSLALDSAGRPCIAYYDETNRRLKYAAWDGAIWRVQIVDGAGDVGRYASLALDSADRPRIAYRDETHGAVKLAAWDGTRWIIQVVDGAGR